MINNLPVRNEGHLFNDLLWINWQGQPLQVRLIADKLSKATLNLLTGGVLVSGELVYEKSYDKGAQTRVLYFVGEKLKVVVSETHLKTS